MKFSFHCVVLLIIATNVRSLDELNCPMYGVSLYGGEVMINGLVATIGSVSTWQMCGYFCMLTPKCKYWRWNRYQAKQCQLLENNNLGRSKTNTYPNTGYWEVSGDKQCFWE